MKKFIILSIIGNISPTQGEITSVANEIDCPTDNESDIRNTITSTRNPDTFFEIISKGKSIEDIDEMQKDFPYIREKFLKSDDIKVNFLPIEKCEESCETCIINAIGQKDVAAFMTIRDLIAAKKLGIAFINVCGD